MAKKRNYPNKRQQKPSRSSASPRVSELVPVLQPTVKKEYGQPFILLEDAELHTFQYQRGAWVPYEKTVAECRVDCQVTALPQKVNKMIRYEVRPPLE